MSSANTVLILGSAPHVMSCRDVPKSRFSSIVAINNAWRVRDDWDVHISPDDFPQDRMPPSPRPDQTLIRSDDYVPANNQFGGIVYAGATMAFTAGYWALAALKPSKMVFVGCDMIYPTGSTAHFYGTGSADPLRDDITLRNLEAKSARLMCYAAIQGCTCLRALSGDSRLIFPSVSLDDLDDPALAPRLPDPPAFHRAESYERQLGYVVDSGRYWEDATSFSVDNIDALDQLWMEVYGLNSEQEQSSVA